MRFYATFGVDSDFKDCVLPVVADDELDARMYLANKHRNIWSSIYSEKEFEQLLLSQVSFNKNKIMLHERVVYPK